MSLIDNHFRHVPEYYDWMYLDGFTPEEIMYALRKKMNREIAEREASGETPPEFEKMIFQIMEKSMKSALDAAIDDLTKDWNKQINIKL